MLVLLFLVALAIAAPVKPNFSEDFSAEVVYTIRRGRDHPRSFHGQWFHDGTAKREKFDVEADHVGRVDLYKFWNNTKGGLEYEDIKAHKVCHHRPFVQPYHGVFDFVAHSHYASTCDGGKGARWTATIPGAFELDVCASEDGTVPYWVERKHLVEHRLEVTARFHEFKAGRPANSQFVIPTECKQKI